MLKCLFYIYNFYKSKSIEDKIKKIIGFLEYDEDYCINSFIKSIMN